METQGWLIVKKQEMTRMWMDDKQVPVTLVVVPKQEVVRHKTSDKDGYSAIVVWADKKRQQGTTPQFGYVCEFKLDEDSLEQFNVGEISPSQMLENAETVTVVGQSKGKGFQGAMKRHHFSGWPKTHGSKFHRALGSTGNRKPKRTNKNQPMAGRMGGDKTTLKWLKIVDQLEVDGDQLIALYGSLPGGYNSYLQLMVV